MDLLTPIPVSHNAPPLYFTPDMLTPGLDDELEEGSDEMPPPRYSSMFDSGRPRRRSCRGRSSRGNTPVTHEFYMKSGGKSTPWATLRLVSQAESAEKMPKYTGGQVSGFVDLVLDNGNPQSVNAVTLTLRGKIISNIQGSGNYSIQHVFLEEQHVIWTKPSSSSSSSSAPSSARRLEGTHSFPFSFPFPTVTEVRVRNRKQLYPTPQTFMERGKHISVQYELALKVSHGFLRADSKLPVVISYIPDIQPTPMSEIRQVAYRDGIALPGPEVDPVGWYTLPPVSITGQLLQRAVEVTCVLSLAKPLIYTRGTIIPVHLVLGSNDTQALDILSSVKVIQLHLVQTIEYFQDPKNVAGPMEDTEIITLAQWWAPSHSAQEAQSRVLFGELHLPKDMQPSSGFALMNVGYTVELVPFVSPVFEAAQRPNCAVTSCPVKIGTAHGSGPIPKGVTSPPARVKASSSLPDPLVSPGSFMCTSGSVF